VFESDGRHENVTNEVLKGLDVTIARTVYTPGPAAQQYIDFNDGPEWARL
jgi:hypothetical protein